MSVKFNYDKTKLMEYGQSIISRFNNENICDELYRITRNPITKLQKNERILDPLLYSFDNNIEANALVVALNGLNYFY
ncbi:mannitol dehydrogenase family protein [Mesoplasma melaleucae]|uniref:mannitol dehydrogenase family protein n=1 Tax=Mesoplasma melaleucae TaxID=81459 RepID=UPI0038CC0980